MTACPLWKNFVYVSEYLHTKSEVCKTFNQLRTYCDELINDMIVFKKKFKKLKTKIIIINSLKADTIGSKITARLSLYGIEKKKL